MGTASTFRFALVAVVVSLLSAPGVLNASDKRPGDRVDEHLVPAALPSDLPANLGADEFLSRGQTTKQWWSDRDRWRSTVVEASRSVDPEIAGRATWVLDRWRRGIVPTTPPHLSRAIESLEPIVAIEILLEASRFEEALVAVREGVGTIDADAIINHLTRLIDDRFPMFVREALRCNQLLTLVDLLGEVTQTGQQAIARLDLLRSMGVPVEEAKWLPQAAETWAAEQRTATLCQIHLQNGNVDEALRLAASTDAQLRRDAEQNPVSVDSPSVSRSLEQVIGLISGRCDDVAEAAIANATALHARWAALNPKRASEVPLDVAEQAEADRLQLEIVRQWIDVLVATRLDAADTFLSPRPQRDQWRDQAVESLMNIARVSGAIDGADDDSSEKRSTLPMEIRTLLWRGLLMSGNANIALQILEKSDRRDAASVAVAMDRFEDVFKWSGFPVDQWDSNIHRWLADTIKMQNAFPQTASRISRLAPRTQEMLEFMQHLLKVGRDDLAHQIAERLSRPDVTAGVFDVQEHVLQRVVAQRRNEWAVEIAMRPWQREPSDKSIETLSQLFVVKDHKILPVLMRSVTLDHPTLRAHDRFRLACAIAMADGELDARVDECLLALSRRLDDGSLTGSNANPRELFRFAVPSTRTWIDLFEGNSRHDLARPLIQRLAAQGDPWAILRVVNDPANETGLELNQISLDQIWDLLTDRPVERVIEGEGHDASLAIDVTVAQLRLAKHAGDHQAAARLLFDLQLMACSPSTDTRQVIAGQIAEVGLVNEAQAIYRGILLTTAIASNETQGLTDIAGGYLRLVGKHVAPTEQLPEVWPRTSSNPSDETSSPSDDERGSRLSPDQVQSRLDALDWWSLAFWGTLESVDYYPSAYVTMPMLLSRNRLELIAHLCVDPKVRGDAIVRDRLERAFDQITQLQPVSIEIAENVLPLLRRRGHGDLADRAIDQIMIAGRAHVRRFPSDRMTANNVAWSAAMNDRNLAEALELACLAVRWEPDSAIYRDTLAECLFRIDEVDQAIHVGRSSVLDDPDLWHLHQQLDRFESAKTTGH